MQISGKDWTLDVSEEDLVRMAMNSLRKNGEKITVQSVAQVSGLPGAQVQSIMRQMLAEQQKGKPMTTQELLMRNEELEARVRELESNQRVMVNHVAMAFAMMAGPVGTEKFREVKNKKRHEMLSHLGLLD